MIKKIIFTPNSLQNQELIKVGELLSTDIFALHFKKEIDFELAKQFLENVPQEYLKKIVLHSHHSLADIFPVKGLHINEQQRKIGYKTHHPIISTSFHILEDLLEAKKFEYAFFSPIFPSISKANYFPKYTIEEIGNFLKLHDLTNIVALGGITEQKISTLAMYGFMGAAMLGNIWE